MSAWLLLQAVPRVNASHYYEKFVVYSVSQRSFAKPFMIFFTSTEVMSSMTTGEKMQKR